MDATSNGGKSRGGHGNNHGHDGQGKGPGFRPRGRAMAGTGERRAASDLTYGALDLGTNNCRLLVATPTAKGMQVIDAFSRIVRLGEGLGHHGRLNDAAMDRTIEALRVCANKLKWHRVSRFRLVATEACRLAENGEGFIRRVTEDVGLELEIIDRETEAHLAAAGAEPLIDREAQTAVVFDIGGGSTEVMWVARSKTGADVHAWTSLAAGVVTLSERHGGGRDVSPERYEAMRDDVRTRLVPFLADVRARVAADAMPDHLLGTSGTVTTIAGVQMGLRHYDRARVDGSWLDEEAADRVTTELRAMSYEERMRNGCIGRERADLVLAGCAILDEIRAAFPNQRIRVADRGLREGILSKLMREDGHKGATA